RPKCLDIFKYPTPGNDTGIKSCRYSIQLSEEETSLISEKLSGSTIVVSGTYKSLSRDR
ncbi:MAG: hypothetical protein HC905_15135, partial [Bacteroidales bacterium]|nr:hypothetical protein [Bacteroidales bacterium]